MKKKEETFSKSLIEALRMAGLDVLRTKKSGKKSVWTVGRIPSSLGGDAVPQAADSSR